MRPAERSVFIDAPPDRVYEAYLDLSRWLEWNPHLRNVKPHTDGPLALGSRVSTAVKGSPIGTAWKVTEISAGRSVTLSSSFPPGVRVVLEHVAERDFGGTRATLRLSIKGPLAIPAWAGWVPVFVTGLPGPMDVMNQNEPGLFYGQKMVRSLKLLKGMIER